VDPDDFLQRRCEQTIRIGIPHILFGGKRQALQVCQAFDVFRADTGSIEGLPIKRDLRIDSRHDSL